MFDDDFERLLDEYLKPTGEPNPQFENVEILWIRGDTKVGAEHIAAHGISELEVEQVLFEIPPEVEAKRHQSSPERTIFWGATRMRRWIFIACEDRMSDGIRYLTPITAFEPEEGEAYWRRQ